MKRVIAALLSLSLLCGLYACGAQQKNERGLRIVCTLFPQYDFVRQIVGDEAQVTLLLPPGTESHAYAPTPGDIVRIGEADLFVYIGDAMETWAPGIMSEIDEAHTQVLNVSEALSLHLSAHAHTDAEETADDADGIDPHIWTSPVLARRMAELLRDTLMELDDAHAPQYAENTGILLAQLENLDNTFRTVTQNAARKTIVCGSRFALRNLTEEYGLSYIAAFDSCTEESEPSAAAVASIVQAIETQHIPVIFYEEMVVPSTAETIAAETGIETRLFHSCHNLTQAEFDAGETYISLMQRNAQYLAEALQETV